MRVRTLREITPDSATLEVRSAGSAAFLTTPLLALMAALPWLSESRASLGWLPPLGLLAVFGVAYLCLRPRREIVALDSGSTLKLERLSESDDPTFRVVVCRGDLEETLLEDRDLGGLARELGVVLEKTRLPLSGSVAIPAGYFFGAGQTLDRPLTELTIEGVPSTGHVRAVRGALGATAFTALVFGWSLLNAQSTISLLSAGLPLAVVLGMGALAAWLWGRRLVVRVSRDRVLAEYVGIGRPRTLLDLPRHDLRGAWLVEHESSPSHVLFATTRGPKVLALLGDPARRLAEAVGKITEAEGGRANTASAPIDKSGLLERAPASLAGPQEGRREARRSLRPEVARARQS